MTRAGAALLLLLGTPARAQDTPLPDPGAPPWYVGLPVAALQLAAPEGGLPEESLEPLLRARQGTPLDQQTVRTDLATLFRVGEFSAVEADVEPWPYVADDGEVVPGAQLTYRVYPAPRIERLRVQGTSATRAQDVLQAARVGPGEVFYPDLDAAPLAERVRESLLRAGFPAARVTVDAPLGEGGSIDVTIGVDEGPPLLLSEVKFLGDVPVPERQLRRWARGAGLKVGRPLSATAVGDAQARLRQKLARLRGGRGGWVEARVTATVAPASDGAHVTVSVEPGLRLVLEVAGLAVSKKRKVRSALDLDERTRLTRGFLEGAPERVETALQERGFLAAEAAVGLTEYPDRREQVLRVDIDRGARHTLRRVDFDGNTSIDDARLRTVMEQASESVVRLGRVTRPELEKGVTAIREVYGATGRLDARVELLAIDTLPSRNLAAAPVVRQLVRGFWYLFYPEVSWDAPERVRVRVGVEEGQLTTLVALTLDGAAPEPDLSFVAAARDHLIDGPYSPQALELVARRVVEAHRKYGYLEADARVERTDTAAGQRSARIVVSPGALVRLRSMVTRGTRYTRTATVRREIELTLGQPITSDDLDTVRERLYDLDIFRTVSTELLGDEDARDLVIDVVERPRWAYEVGGGFSSDQGVRTLGRISRHNLWGRAHRMDVFGLLGLDWTSDSLRDWTPDISNPEARIAVSYTAPHFPLRQQDLVIDALLGERRQERTWQMARSGLGASLETRFGRKTTLLNGVRVEARRLVTFDPGALLAEEIWNKIPAPLVAGDPSPWRLQDSLTSLLVVDLRDSPLAPTRGAILSVFGEWAPGLQVAAGDRPRVSFIKGEVRASGYVPIRRSTLHLSLETGRAWMLAPGVLPLEDRYRLGGTGSVRGFERDALGPRNEVDQVDVDWPDALAPVIDTTLRKHPTRWVPTGGDAMVKGQIEIIVPWTLLPGLRTWDGYAFSLFSDAGTLLLLDKEADPTSSQEPYVSIFDPLVRYGVGAGVRVATPVGPFQVDLAFNPELMRASARRRALLADAWGEPSVRLHLALGSL